MPKKKDWILIFGTLASVSVLFAGMASAWFTLHRLIPLQKTIEGGTNAAYFAGGDGTKEVTKDSAGNIRTAGPYRITNVRHLYNLAWLQYLGKFSESRKIKDSSGALVDSPDYYFEIDKDLDMKGFTLPPIGTEKNPFLGHLEGNSHTVKNLTVSNSYADFSSHRPYAVTEAVWNKDIPEVVGFFGSVGSFPTSSVSLSSTITGAENLYLENLAVQAKSTNALVGAFAGYVNAPVSNVGVGKSTLSFGQKTSSLSATGGKRPSLFHLGLEVLPDWGVQPLLPGVGRRSGRQRLRRHPGPETAVYGLRKQRHFEEAGHADQDVRSYPRDPCFR